MSHDAQPVEEDEKQSQPFFTLEGYSTDLKADEIRSLGRAIFAI